MAFISSNPEDLHGLTIHQIISMIRFPFECPDVVRFNPGVSPPDDAPYPRLLLSLLTGIDRAGGSVRTTGKGNLPRNLCREIQKEFLDIYYHLQIGPIHSEEMFTELHTIRIVAQMAGYLRKRLNRFYLTKRGKKLVEEGISGEEFLHLLKTYTLKFNWSYTDAAPEVKYLQNTFLFTLYLLKLYGEDFKPSRFYASLVVKCFPLLLDDLLKNRIPIGTPEDEFEFVYTLRMFKRFAVAFGLAEMKEVKGDEPYKIEEFFRKTPFLDEFVRFFPQGRFYH